MDFLASLALSREDQSSRAVAVLPARFAKDAPLRAMAVETRFEERIGEEERQLSPFASLSSTPPLSSSPAFLRHRRSIEISSAPDSSGAPPEASRRTLESPSVPDEASERNARPQTEQGAHTASVRPYGTARAADHAARASGNAPPLAAPASMPAPLSSAMLLQRAIRPADEGAVVHVTIGRIDVNANTSPPAAAPRTPAPRRPTVALADYLRGAHGGSR